MPGAPSSFLLLVAMPFAPSSGVSIGPVQVLKLGRGHESDVRIADVSISRGGSWRSRQGVHRRWKKRIYIYIYVYSLINLIISDLIAMPPKHQHVLLNQMKDAPQCDSRSSCGLVGFKHIQITKCREAYHPSGGCVSVFLTEFLTIH